MIKGNTSVDGLPIESLGRCSKKRVIRICEVCGREDNVSYQTYVEQKETHAKYGNTKHSVCEKCRYKVLPEASNKGKKVSDEAKKRMQRSWEGRRKGIRYTSVVNGYVVRYDQVCAGSRRGKTVFIHRENYEKAYNEVLSPSDQIHHINCNSLDNRSENLIKTSASEHKKMHNALGSLAGSLLDRGIICFNRETKTYYINPEIDVITKPISLSFKDVAIEQQKNVCASRMDVDTSSEIISGIVRPIPLIASNMSTVVNADFCIKLFELGAMGVLHRADTVENLCASVKKIANTCDVVACSVGVGDNQKDLAKALIRSGANVVFIDIANGFTDALTDMAVFIKKFGGSNTRVVAGNFTNVDILNRFVGLFSAVKVGIAQGLACETKNTAGCTDGQFSTVLRFKQISKDTGIPIISDGGIREPADFTKAIGAGARAVMAGSIFAACPESAAEVVEVEGLQKKLYAGMASRYVQDKWKGGLKRGTCPEGKVVYLDVGESVGNLIERYSGALRSGITYSGGNSILTFQEKVKFNRVTQ